MDSSAISRMIATSQLLPTTDAPATAGGLPQALHQGINAAMKSSMQRLSSNTELLIDLPMPRTPVVGVPISLGPLLDIPMPRTPLVDVQMPRTPLVEVQMPRMNDSPWQLPVLQPPLVLSPMAIPSPPPLTSEQQMAAQGKAMLEELDRQPPPTSKRGRKRLRKKLKHLNEQPEVIAYRRQQAESFKHNYIPSSGGAGPREITRNDALKELYAYSDYLPKKTSLKTLQEIVDGTFGGDRPPQLVAAARYMLDHPDEWKQVTGKEGDDRIKRAALNDALSRNIQLGGSQLRTLETLEKNADDFFDGRRFGREKLQKIIGDPDSKRENVEVAKQLLADPVLFGMLDNTEYGHKSNGWRKSDDGLIGRNDLRGFMEKLNRTAAPEPAEQPRLFTTAADTDAAQAMLKAQESRPLEKTVKGGQAKKFVSGVMKGLSVFYEVGSAAMKAVAALKIPLVSQAAALGSMVTNAYSGLLKVGRTAINDGDVKAEAAKAGISFASNAISTVTAPGAGKVVTSVATEAAKAAAKGAAKEVLKQGGNEIADRVKI